MKLMLNLASRTYLNRRALRFFYLAVIAVLMLLAAVNLYGYLRSHAEVGQLTAWLAEIERQQKPPRREEQKMTKQEQQTLMADVDFANQNLKMDDFHWTQLLDHLEAVVPERVSIRGIRPDFRQGSFTLTGNARSVDDLRGFLDNLHASTEFNDVYLLQQSRQELQDGTPLLNFSIVVKGAF
jgi:type IV pilus assembly protein PilN